MADISGITLPKGDSYDFKDKKAREQIEKISGEMKEGDYLPLAGGTLAGPLILAADPTENMEAATKQYVDDRMFSLVQVPAVVVGTYTYNGKAQGPTITGIDAERTAVTNATETAVGTYTLTIALKDSTKMAWTDMTTAPKTYSYRIEKKKITVPTVTDTSYIYDGKPHSPTFAAPDVTYVTTSGSSATNAGNYTLKFALNDKTNTVWNDDTTTDKSTPWSIAKAPGTLTLSATAVTLDKATTSTTVTASGYQGSLSVSSADPTVVVATLNGSTITLKSPSGKSGTIAVTVTSAATANYAAASKTITVTADYLYINTFANTVKNGHLAEVADALEAGTITTDNLVWAVGDEATINNQTWVIQNIGGKTMASGKECSYVIGMKHCLSSTGQMNSSGTSSGGWDKCAMRTYCNGDFKDGLPADVKAAFKQFKNITANGSGSSTAESTDYFALPSEKEVFGSTSYANNTAESSNSQFEWYKASANRIKKLGDSNSAQWWWERSPYSGNSTNFCIVYSDGGANSNGAGGSFGVSPFGCI